MPLSTLPPRTTTALSLFVIGLLVCSSHAYAQETPPALASLIETCWAAIRAGAPADAIRSAEAALERSGESGEWTDRAHLARSAGLYALGRTREAAVAARAIDDLERAVEGVDRVAMPGGFGTWVRAARTSASAAAAPEITLTELNPEREIREVSTHFELDVEIVRIPVIVEDIEGEFVTGLGREDFSVLDGGPPAQPVYQVIREAEPTSVGILIDASDAAREETPVLLESVMQLIGQLKDEDEVFLLQFGDEPRFLSDFTADSEALLAALADYEPTGSRALRDALATGLIRMRDATWDKKSLVMITFGEDDGSRTDAVEVRRAAQRDGVALHAILLPAQLERWRPGEEDDRPTFLLQRLAFETGGLVAIRPDSADRYGGLSGWIDLAAQDVGSYIRHQYLLQFESTDPPPPGEWRPLRVVVEHGELKIERVRARSGYVR